MVRKKRFTYLQEYQDVTGTSAAQGQPKYYAMFGGAQENQILHLVEYL